MIRPLLTVSFLALLAVPLAAQPTGQLDGIVAVVGDNVILRTDVDALALQYARGNALTTEMRQVALDELINQHVLIEHAERDTTVTISPDEINQTLDERTDALVRQLGSEAEVEALYGRSIAQIREDFRDDVRDQLLAQTFQRRKYFQIRVTPQEVREWFSAIPTDSIPDVPALVRVSHIVRFPEINAAARTAALDKITSIRDSILAGTPIETLAGQFSEDPGSSQRGGRYERINIRDLVPEFGAVAATTEPGALSQVFETQFGYHVLRLNDRVGDTVDFNHVLVRIDETSTDPTEAIATLEMLRDSVLTRNGSFAQLAKEFSEDESTAARGGLVVVPQTGDRDLRLEALDPTWRATLDTMAVGGISEPTPVRLLDGRSAYHIVQLNKRQEPHTLSLETDYTLIQDFALQEKRQRELSAWIDKLRREVHISIKDDTLRPTDFAG